MHSFPGQTALVVELTWNLPGGLSGVFALLEDADGRLTEKRDLLYVENPVGADHSVTLREVGGAGHGARRAQLACALSDVPDRVQRVELLLIPRVEHLTLKDASDVRVRCWDPTDGRTLADFRAPAPGLSKTYVLGILARSEDGWAYQPIERPEHSEAHVIAAARARGITSSV